MATSTQYRHEECPECRGDGVIYLGGPNSPDSGWNYECPTCNGQGFVSIPHLHIQMRELPSPYGGTYAVASCGSVTATGAWAGEAIDELTDRLQDRRAA